MAKKKRILYVYPYLSSFIEVDLNLLRDEFEVIPLQYRGKKDIFRLLKYIITTDLNVSWFALGHATLAILFSRIFRKKSVIITGGWDVVSMPEIGYGAMIGKKRIRKTCYALKHACKVIAVSESTKSWVLKWVKRHDIIILPLGFDAEKFVSKGLKEDMVVSVGRLANEVTIKVKGLDVFKNVSELLPNVKFVLIGKHDPKIANIWKAKALPNFEIVDFLPENKLIEYFQRAKVYAQLSYQEAFGCAMAEAILCGCVPVVTKRGGIPEVAGDVAYYVDYGDVKDTAEKIKEALISDRGSEARDRIVNHFPLKKRREKLTEILYGCLE